MKKSVFQLPPGNARRGGLAVERIFHLQKMEVTTMFETKVIATRGGVPLRAAKGHFATNHSHINYFIDITTQKTRLAEAIIAAGLPGRISNTAGTYVCNDTLYRLLRHYAGSDVQVGFVHVPCLPEQAKEGEAAMALGDIIAALTVAVGVLG